MTPIVFAVPYIPPAPLPDPWPGISQVWIGWDDSVWPLNGEAAEGVYFAPGVRGRTMPDGEHSVDETAGVEGGRWRGWRAGVREVFWPLWVWKDGGSQAWLDYDSAFFRTLNPRRTGRWVVTQPNGQKRTLVCRFVSDGGGAGDFAPGIQAWARYGIYLQAEQPYWSGDTVARWFSSSEEQDFFSTDPDTVIHISEGSTLAGAVVSNPGDEDAWPTWWVTDVTSAVVGVDELSVVVPFAVDEDRLLVIDSDPDELSAIEIDMYGPDLSRAEQEAWVASHLAAGVDRTEELGAATQFGMIPAGDSVELTISMVGTGSVRVSFVPQYHRAW